ncbi:hypothetical protein Pelo_6016 [Pelomyxa schiedti]|nr:hypothetical protein Pelo_6016 [Pelomyxa schiedti]
MEVLKKLRASLMPCRQIVLWVLSNLAVGTKEQVTELCKSGVIPHVVTCLSSPKGDVCIREEACWVIANCIETNHPEVIQCVI